MSEAPTTYVDGFVCPVKVENRDAYLKSAQVTATLFKELGALAVVENWGDDVPEGKLTSLPMAVKLEAGEVVVFSWVVWPSKEVRNIAWEKAEADPRMAEMDMPFDGKRLIYGGFQTIFTA
ncbi:DUF1428 domain-containing protein [Asticcacaulis sp. DW145]|uniref:DUF1428 domain-containing protein n=1 Tax=Asticcacaulis currens TaxID=2984210 RepID=A0ABT5IAM9_9CAUL|nr:DUF1428 domain-containing protein [Asticcacaulis currens]MDC7693173.1 DUF1428 domain-containing protein [Asticcacaulis currens]BEV09765.1 DUF1428 domain-containing protein [Asticcacaulis sp. DW145]